MANVPEELGAIEERVMGGLKDFQKATVNRIVELYENGQHRVLVADEVGLGKTLIARGTIARMAKLHREKGDDLFKVVYICSNSAIADQNLEKLRITDEAKVESSSSSRLSMQHLNIYQQENDPELRKKYIQLIPLTPDTSFRMTGGCGTVAERALMFAFLQRIEKLNEYHDELEIAMRDKAYSSWDRCKEDYECAVVACNKSPNGRYLTEMLDKLHAELSQNWHDNVSYLDGILDWCKEIRKRNKGKKEDQSERVPADRLIVQLRMIFAKISLERLEPDLVIMDEFQRFKYLLDADPKSETGMLADKFFHSRGMDMLLLSATPYKMYSTPEEIDETRIDEHYSEFLLVMNFLNDGSDKENQFMTVWENYSMKLKELTMGDTSILSAKNAAEDAMYQTVCRTERDSDKESADLISIEKVKDLDVLEQDIRSYIEIQELIGAIRKSYHVPVDYVKSTPYLMSFMMDYQLKRDIETYFKRHPDEIQKTKKDTLWLKKSDFDHYKEISPNHAKLKQVMDLIFREDADKLLWMPPSKPYYELQGVYAGKEFLTKTLIFSSWEMVPRMLACMVSYEAERRTVGKLASDYHDKEVRYFHSDARRFPPARLNFSMNKGTPSGMYLFCLIYPSQFLTECYEPISCMNEGLSIQGIRERVREKIGEKMQEYESPSDGRVDRHWYYLAPLLLDGEDYARQWLEQKEDLIHYVGEEEKSGRKSGEDFRSHVDTLDKVFTETLERHCSNLGRKPDDLLDVLADMAIAAPAVCINRTYCSYLPDGMSVESSMPSQLARVFLNRMNTPESTAIVELASEGKSADAHWRNLLDYCVKGNLQAVFDEYAHLISSGIDCNHTLVRQIHSQMLEAMNIRTTSYKVDTFHSFQKRVDGQGRKDGSPHVRTHFAVAFNKGDGEESDQNRKKTIRNAFNSPFRPFVLATTSIGQEGLDFHPYCRRIVHWNLPSNPIDLEQREGRINRFECLAIRQNVARRYGNINFQKDVKDVWDEMFKEASKNEKKAGSSDLIPYWGLREKKDMVKIERIVPMYPFSRDHMVYERLIKILSMYRLTLGQARQGELLEYLFKNCDEPEKLKDLFLNLSPFYKQSEAT